jgi:L-alanine-DL-glutamate epimerase-like enolase superfamily enzyme
MAQFDPLWVEEPLYPPEDFETLARLRQASGVPLAMGENATSMSDYRRMVATGAADYVQPAIVKMGGITALAKIAAEVETAGATCVPNVFYLGPGYLAALHCLAVKEKQSPLERMFADLGATPYAKSVPIIDGKVEVPRSPGLGADPEEELIQQFKA